MSSVLDFIIGGIAVVALLGWYQSWQHALFMKRQADYWHDNYQTVLDDHIDLIGSRSGSPATPRVSDGEKP